MLRLGPYKGGPAAHCKPRLLSHHCLSFVQPLAYNNRWYSNQQHHLQNVCGLFPHVHLPTHFVRRTNQPYCLRTLPFLSVNLSHNTPTSELHRVLAGIEGVSPIPIVRRSHSNHVSPEIPSGLAVTEERVSPFPLSITIIPHLNQLSRLYTAYHQSLLRDVP